MSVALIKSVSDDSFTVYENVNLTIIQFYDCNGEINGSAIEDCNGICEGLSILDDCGICDTDYLNDNQTCTGCTNMNACNYDPLAIFDNGAGIIFHEYFSLLDLTIIGITPFNPLIAYLTA